MLKKKKSCCFLCQKSIFHSFNYYERNIKYGQTLIDLVREIRYLIEDCDVTDFYIGVELLTEFYIGEFLLEYKELYPHIKIHVVLPFEWRTTRKNKIYLERFAKIIKNADTYDVIDKKRINRHVFEKNKYMVEKSNVVVLVGKEKKLVEDYKLIKDKSDKKVRFIKTKY